MEILERPDRLIQSLKFNSEFANIRVHEGTVRELQDPAWGPRDWTIYLHDGKRIYACIIQCSETIRFT